MLEAGLLCLYSNSLFCEWDTQQYVCVANEEILYSSVPRGINTCSVKLKSKWNVSHLLKLEDVLVEVVLETLVGKVDAELLETVVLVVLKAEDVKHSDGQDLMDILFIYLFFKKQLIKIFNNTFVVKAATVQYRMYWPTLVVSMRSLMLRRAWLILKTIQSNRALYRDLAMESRTVLA